MSSLPQTRRHDRAYRHNHTTLDSYQQAGQAIRVRPHTIVGGARPSLSDCHEMERWKETSGSTLRSTWLPSTSTSDQQDTSTIGQTDRGANLMHRSRSAWVSLGLLSLLPVQAGARPAGRDDAGQSASASSARSITASPRRNAWTPDGYLVQAKRDRRRSNERRPRERPSNDRERVVRVDREPAATPRWVTRTSSLLPTATSSSSQLSPTRPTPAPPLHTQYRKDGIPPAEPTSTPTPTTDSTFQRITVPNTILPYLLTTASDGQIGTANWELYGRVAQDPSIVGRADETTTVTIMTSLLDPTEPETSSSTSTSGSVATQLSAAEFDGMDETFLITDALPRGWGIESDRGDLYAVPLITVASVCLAAVIFCFIVITVVSRAKAKRRRARRERRKAQLMKNERARQTTTERADSTDLPGHGVAGGERYRDEESSLGDAENGIGDIIRSERVAGQADQQRSNGGRFSTNDSDAERDDVLEQKLKTAGQSNRAKVRRVVSVGVGRLGNGRVLEWRKGLRKRKTMSNAPAAAQDGVPPVRPILIDPRDSSNRQRSSTSLVEGSGEGSSETAVDSEARARGGDSASRVTTSERPDSTESPGSTLPSELPLTRTISRAVTRTTESGEQARPDAAAPELSITQSGDPTPPRNPASVTFAAPHFPPAYYQETAAQGTSVAGAGSREVPDDLPQHGETDGSTSVQGGPVTASARALEKRPANYYPAPTTADQEDAVAIAFGHGSLGRSAGMEDLSGSQPPDIGALNQTMGDTAIRGHLATDDKGVLEQLRNAASMPATSSEPAAEHSPVHAQHSIRDASAPAIDVDEDGFERLEAAQVGEVALDSDALAASPSFPTPPRPILQSSYLAAPSTPSAPSFGGDLDNGAPNLASAPLAVAEDDAPIMSPSAPLALEDIDEGHDHDRQAAQSPVVPAPSAPSADDAAAVSSASLVQPTPAARASHARRSLGLDLPTEEPGTAVTHVEEQALVAPTTRFLPKYEP